MMRCARCSKQIDALRERFHVGPYKAVKCTRCGPWTRAEMAQILQRFGARPDAFDAGCACSGSRT